MSFTEVFGGTTLYPADVSYLPLTLDADKSLAWPLESNDPENPAASIIDVTTSGAFSVTLPDATQTGAGQTILFNNLSASSNSFLVKDAAGGTIATVGIGEQWQVYLAGTATAAGTWRVLRYGASTATVQPSALAGYGLTVTSNTLSQSLPVTTFNSGPRTVLLTDRASALVWNGTGAGVLNLPSAATAGNNFFIGVRNSGGGDLTVDAAGSELIDGVATLALRPGDSANLLTDGLSWYTLGLGQQAVFAFDYTSISVTGGTYTLAGSELNRIVYKFVGVLAADQYIVVPATVQQYWVDNATTGAYALYLRTSAGTPVLVPSGSRGIYYCNGANVVDADTSTISLPVNVADGGTGISSYSTGDLLYASAASTLSKLSSAAVGNALLSGGVGTAPLWGKVSLTSTVSGTLPVANGGTGATTSTGSGAVVLATSPTLTTPDIGTPSAATLTNATGLPIVAGTTGTLSVARGGSGTATAFTAGSLVFAGTSGVYSQDNTNLFWNNTTKALGIGTAAPANRLHVSGTGLIDAVVQGSTSSGLSLYQASGAAGFRVGRSILTDNAQNFFVYDDVAAATRLYISAAGNVSIGTTDDNINSGVGCKLRTGGSIASVSAGSDNGSIGFSMYSTGAAAYRFYVGFGGQIYATNTSIAAISDIRMKENVRDLEYGLPAVLALRPRRFDWRKGKGKDCKDDIGFIAQEVEAVVPELIGGWLGGAGDPADLKSLKTGELVPILVKAIQELTARVAELEARGA